MRFSFLFAAALAIACGSRSELPLVEPQPGTGGEPNAGGGGLGGGGAAPACAGGRAWPLTASWSFDALPAPGALRPELVATRADRSELAFTLLAEQTMLWHAAFEPWSVPVGSNLELSNRAALTDASFGYALGHSAEDGAFALLLGTPGLDRLELAPAVFPGATEPGVESEHAFPASPGVSPRFVVPGAAAGAYQHLLVQEHDYGWGRTLTALALPASGDPLPESVPFACAGDATGARALATGDVFRIAATSAVPIKECTGPTSSPPYELIVATYAPTAKKPFVPLVELSEGSSIVIIGFERAADGGYWIAWVRETSRNRSVLRVMKLTEQGFLVFPPLNVAQVVWPPVAAAALVGDRLGAVALEEDPDGGDLRFRVRLVSPDGDAEQAIELAARGDGAALAGSPSGTQLVVAITSSDEQIVPSVSINRFGCP